MSMLKPGLGHTHKAYIWSYGTTQFDASPLVSTTSPRVAAVIMRAHS